jgi:hypothetical protein
MGPVSTNTTISISSIEEILGNPKNRYFSNGFLNVKFDYKDLYFKNHSIECNLLFSFNQLWSQKNQQFLKPHVGIVEYYTTSVFFTEFLLKAYLGLNDEDISRSWVSFFSVKSRPSVLTDEENIHFKAQLINTSPLNIRSSHFLNFKSIVNIEFGKMKILIDINHPVQQPGKSQTCLPVIIDHGLYKTGYKQVSHRIKNIELDLANLSVSSEINLSGQIPPDQCRGIGRNYRSCMISDHYLTTGQLMQVLLYEMDSISREESNNMWVREVKTYYPEPIPRPVSFNTLQATETNIVRMKNENWRLATIKAMHDSITSYIKVSHKLPN